MAAIAREIARRRTAVACNVDVPLAVVIFNVDDALEVVVCDVVWEEVVCNAAWDGDVLVIPLLLLSTLVIQMSKALTTL